jgi:hypothetical protein
MSWTVFHCQLEAVAEHNNWIDWGKATLQGQDADDLHNIPTEVRYKHITEELEGCSGDHQLAVVYHS